MLFCQDKLTFLTGWQTPQPGTVGGYQLAEQVAGCHVRIGFSFCPTSQITYR